MVVVSYTRITSKGTDDMCSDVYITELCVNKRLSRSSVFRLCPELPDFSFITVPTREKTSEVPFWVKERKRSKVSDDARNSSTGEGGNSFRRHRLRKSAT